MTRTSSRKKQPVNYSENSAGNTKPTATPAAKAKQSAPKAATKRKAKPEPDESDEAVAEPESEPEEDVRPAKKAKTKVKPEPKDTSKANPDVDQQPAKKPKAQPKPRAKGKAKGEDTMPLAQRTAVSSLGKSMYIGAHVSAAGGVNNSITNAVQIGANAFALFLKSQRKWESPPMASETRDLFASGCKEHGYSPGEHALPHGSYLVNLAQADEAKATQAYKSFVDDLGRCEELGIRLYNFHPGSTGGEPRPEAIGRIAAQLNRSHKATKTVVTVLENMAGSGNVIGSTWEDLRDIIALVDDKDRVGVCIDTCHAFAAGYDMRTPGTYRETMDAFNKTVGAKYLKAFHLNDSKAPFNSNRDLHANIGTGFLGLRAFHSIVNDDALCGMPMVLETPIDRKGPDGKSVEDRQVWADEIKLLEGLVGMDPDSDEFAAMAADLQARGTDERARIQGQVDKKSAKVAKKGSRGVTKAAPAKRKRKAESASESDGGSE